MKRYSFVFLSAGTGSRLGGEMPKQYMEIGGKPIYLHTLDRIRHIDEVSEVVIVAAKEYFAPIDEALKSRGFDKPYVITEGGATRQASVLCGLKAAKEENVIIHEAARPFVSREDFLRLINDGSSDAIFGAGISFTVLEGGEYIEKILDRSRLINVQLPQKFAREPLLAAHLRAEAEDRFFTEDACLLYYYTGTDIRVLRGMDYNLKITTPVDLIIGAQIYSDYFAGKEI